MSDRSAGSADRAASALVRIGRAWRRLTSQQRGAALAAGALFVTMFLPWFSTTEHGTRAGSHPQSQSFTAWDSFSFVEAAVLVVAAAVLLLLFHRAEERAFHLPGGDGSVITIAGLWTCFLVVWRMFDRQGSTTDGQIVISSGIEWGIFGALFAAAGLAYAGTRIRASHSPEPPLPMDDDAVFDGHWSEPVRASSGPGLPRAATVAAPELREADTSSPARATRRPRRSSWRPAERPEWTEPERRVDRE